MPLNLDLWLEWANDCKYLPENDLKELCDYVADILIEEPNIISTSAPITVCGDVHGQFYDVEELFRTGGLIPDTKYIFMGDFVDRGYYSLETWTKLIILKAKYPNHIFLIRGNHESRGITQSYGFYDECIRKYGNANPWKFCCKLFDLLAIAAVIDNSVMCVHGGLSPLLNTLEMIQVIERKVEVPNKGGFCDLLWSDPEEVENWEISPRGAGWLFGESVTKEFMHVNNISLICRAHQLVNEGYKFMFGEKLVTVWSAPNYCYRCGNIASIMEFKTATNHRPLLFDAVQTHNRKVPPTQTIPYFL